MSTPEDRPPPVLELTADMLADRPAKRRLDFEKGMRRAPPLTMFLIAALTAIFIWQVASGALRDEQALMRAGALERDAVLRNNEWWRIPASTMLHGSVDHLVGNCLGLFLLGLAVEHAFGVGYAALMYGAAGVAGALASLLVEGGPTVGASGAIFGWWGASIVFFYRYRSKLLMRDARVGFVLLVWAGWSIATGFLSPQISNFSHLGGLLAGATAALVIPARLPELSDTA